MEKYTLALFERGTQMAAERGLILVDTKYEFGKHNGETKTAAGICPLLVSKIEDDVFSHG